MSVIRIALDDIFESRAQTLVNTVNCVGVMGKGIALEFKRRFPEMYLDYVQRCARGEVRLGQPYLFADLVGPWVLNFPTKGHWRAASLKADIEAGLRYLDAHCQDWGITSLAVPPLGCGNGGLEWRQLGPVLYRYLSQFTIPVELYAPCSAPPDQLLVEFLSSTNHVSMKTG
ncbi:MAG: macro domain-containing protein [Dehalococcoidia bacterium]